MKPHHNTPGTRETYIYYRLPATYDMVISLSRIRLHLPRMESGLLSTLYADLTRSHLIFMNHFHSYQYCFPFSLHTLQREAEPSCIKGTDTALYAQQFHSMNVDSNFHQTRDICAVYTLSFT